MIEISIERLPDTADLPLPARATAGSAGLDLLANIDPNQEFNIEPGRWRAVRTGIKIAIPQGYEGQIRPRSGLAMKHGVTVLNAPGTIDSDYRGEISVLLINLNHECFRISRGSRIAQIVFAPVTEIRWQERPVNATERGEGGFGSTGMA